MSKSDKLDRANFMTESQRALWAAAEEKRGTKIPRTHQNCMEILKVARPGKTAKDKRHR